MTIFAGQPDLLAELLAATATWQTITRTSTAANAKKKIITPEAQDDGQYKLEYPRILIYDGGTIEREKLATATWGGRGSMFLTFEVELTQANGATTAAQRSYFANLISTLMREAEVISDSRATPAGYDFTHLQVRRYRRTEGPHYVDPTERPEQEGAFKWLWQMEFEVEY